MKAFLLYYLIVPFFIIDGVYLIMRSIKAVRTKMSVSEKLVPADSLWYLLNFKLIISAAYMSLRAFFAKQSPVFK